VARHEAAQRQISDYDRMTVPQLKDHIKVLTGKKPRFGDKQQLIDIVEAHRSVPPAVDDGMKTNLEKAQKSFRIYLCIIIIIIILYQYFRDRS